jgi:hypothetical protein
MASRWCPGRRRCRQSDAGIPGGDGNPSDSTAQEEELAMAAYLLAGFIVTVPDYEGTNLDWGAGQESGYGTLDAIRATESYLGATPTRSMSLPWSPSSTT